MKAVNLLPPDRRTAKRATASIDAGRRNLLIASGVVGALVVVGLSVMVWSSNSSISDKRKQLQTLQSEISSTSASSSLAAGMGTKKGAVLSLVPQRMAWDQMLNALSKVVPEDVWISSLTSTTPGAAANAAAAAAAAAAASASSSTTTASSSSTTPPQTSSSSSSTFAVSGYTYSQPSVARMMRRLGIVPWLTGVTLVSSTRSTIGSDTVYQFSLKATLVPLTSTAP
jgi:Tfp pilus assembly protein PilN